jgi:hypothetical protein
VVADSATDVQVLVNSVPASIDGVFGLLGAIVLTNKPMHTDVVLADYSYMSNPPTQFLRLNSPEFNLNEAGNGNLTGLPGHQYRARAALVDPTDSNSLPTITSPVQPLQIGWKYKMYERGYTACLNDPNTLLLNVPTNRVFFPVLNDQVFEIVIRYDPTTLPDQATDPWTLEGQGTMSLAPGGGGLTIIDSNPSSGPGIEPPFYTHAIDLTFDSTVSAAFRVSMSATVPDGCFSGVAFGISDGEKVAIAGLILTDANNLSSAIVRLNDLVTAYTAHLTQVNVHRPNDLVDDVTVVPATDLTSLIILANNLKLVFNQHISYGGGNIHLLSDPGDTIIAPDAVDLPSALILINQIWTNFNAHLTAPGVHYNNDTVNSVGLVQQIGFLNNSGYPEFETSWNSYAVDWSEDATYRVFRDQFGNVSLYTSGAVVPITSATNAQLPAASDIDMKLDPMSQVFFGSIGRRTTSTSKWSFIRVDVVPIDEDQIGDNKSVNYQPTVLPELDPNAPWITIGQAGFERLTTGPNKLVLDSTASAPPAEIAALGMTTGAYRGFLRLEPILTRVASSTVQFTANVVYYTFSLDNKAAGVFLDDDTFSTWFVFLQDTPTPATVTGTTSAPFSIATGDYAIIGIGTAEPFTITFTAPATTTAEVITVINTAVGFALASANGANQIVLTDQTRGASSEIRLIAGIGPNAVVLQKLGLAVGTYYGLDSNPEPKVSWFGATTPDQDTPQWSAIGMQTSEMLGRTMRITDSSTTDFLVYSINNPLYTGSILDPAVDWKVDFRLVVQSFTAGAIIASGTNLAFAGVLVNVDEGTSGKNIELQYAVDQFGGTYINVLSFNSISGFLDQQAAFPFLWDDGQIHSIDLFTNKTAGICMVLADNVSLGTFSYPALHSGISGPALTFGSGASASANGDPSTAQSVVDWKSVCVFRDLKLADPTASSRRYVGIYGGGDPSLLDSYYIAQVDWTAAHTYRITRDPATNVSVFIDGGNIPIISVNYDSLRLPLVSASFLQPITENRECVAFGSFEPEEISRTVWGPFQYSIGKITLTNRLIPDHQTVNQANTVVSPEHLHTQIPHAHSGFNVYSGGTPSTDFISNPSLPAYTVLGEGTPPVPMTQDLESRGGLVRTATVQDTVDPLDFVDESGFLTDLENDTTNGTLLFTPLTLNDALLICNTLQIAFNAHLTQYRVHLSNDPDDTVITSPLAGTTAGITFLAGTNTIFDLTGILPSMVGQTILIQGAAHAANNGVFTIATIPVVNSGSAASIAAAIGGVAQFSDPFPAYEFTPADIGKDITISGPGAPPDAASAVNVGTFKIVTWTSATQVGIANSIAVLDANNGSIGWIEASPSSVTVTNAAGATDANNGYITWTLSVPTSPAADLPSGIILANLLKANFNTHRTAVVDDSDAPAHVLNDTVNVVSAADAVDLPSLWTLSQAINVAYNAHLTQAGVHANSIFIHLAPPDQVIYEGAEFFPLVSGVPGLVAPYAETSVVGKLASPSWIQGTIGTSVSGVATFTDNIASPFQASNVGDYLFISHATLVVNNSALGSIGFQIIGFVSASQVTIATLVADGSAAETNNGSLDYYINIVLV